MPKKRKTLLVFIIILIQSLLAASAGVTAISMSSGKLIPPGTTAGGALIGGLDESEAARRIDDHYAKALDKQSLELVLDGTIKFSIPYNDIDAHVDGSATLKAVDKDARWLPNLISAYFGANRLSLKPVVILNEGKLREKLMEFSKEVDREPGNASIAYKGGKLEKTIDSYGLKLDIGNTVKTIKDRLTSNLGQPIALVSSKNYEVKTTPAAVRLKDIDDIRLILASYSTDILDPELSDSIVLSANAVNGILLQSGAEFSFVEELEKKDADFENDNEGYDQVASTLYAAILSAGIDKSAITRLPHKLAADYIEPGLDAWISGNAGDLKFTNTFGQKLEILTSLENNHVTVVLAGTAADKAEKYSITTEIAQKFDPTVVEVENNDLKPGEKVLLSQGKQGEKVNVYRNKELISTDKYDAEDTIVQVGPGTGWVDDQK